MRASISGKERTAKGHASRFYMWALVWLQYWVETLSLIVSILVKVPAVGGASWVTQLWRHACNHSGILLDEHKRDDIQTTNKPRNHSPTVCSGIIPSMFWNITVMLVERNRHAGRSKPAVKLMTASAAVTIWREWQSSELASDGCKRHTAEHWVTDSRLHASAFLPVGHGCLCRRCRCNMCRRNGRWAAGSKRRGVVVRVSASHNDRPRS